MYRYKPRATPGQIRMARAALKLGIRNLAEQAGTSTTTLVKLEAGGNVAKCIVEPILKTLEDAGVEFIDETRRRGCGVRLVKPTKKRNRKEAGRKGAITRSRNKLYKRVSKGNITV